jgi:plasmid stability protein
MTIRGFANLPSDPPLPSFSERDPDALYKKLRARAKREHRSIAQEVIHLLSDAIETPKTLSILELRGLGKEHWREVDAAEHVEHERASWD